MLFLALKFILQKKQQVNCLGICRRAFIARKMNIPRVNRIDNRLAIQINSVNEEMSFYWGEMVNLAGKFMISKIANGAF